MKKIKYLAIIILMITILAVLITKVEATTGKVNSETVRLRKEPNTSSTILEQLDKNKEVEILEEEDDWYKVTVKVNGETLTGYISKRLVDVETSSITEQPSNTTINTEEPTNTATSTNTEEPTSTVTSNDIEELQNSNEQPVTTDISNNIKEEQEYTLEQAIAIKVLPLMNSRTKATISGNVKAIEIINDWCRIENDTETGWVRINTLKKSLAQTEVPVQNSEEQPEEQHEESTVEQPIEDTNEPETTPTSTTINKTGYVNADGLRVRKEPSTSSEEIDSLSKNDKVEIIGEDDGWYKININGGIGYVSAKYISDTKLPETTSRSGSTLKTQTTASTQTENTTEAAPEAASSETTTSTPTTSATGEAVVAYAKQYLGYKYVSGGSSPETGFDCSGFTCYVYKHFGISLNRTSKDQIKNGVAVEKSNLQPGDIVIFNNSSNTAIGHVGIYVGEGNFIHASNPGEGVKITALSSSYYSIRYVGARRVI